MTNRTNRIESDEVIHSPVQKRENNYPYHSKDNQTNRDTTNKVPNASNQYKEHEEMVVPALANKGVKRNIEEEFYSEAKVNESLVGMRSPSTIKK